MPRFDVVVGRRTEDHATIPVIAENKEAAINGALSTAKYGTVDEEEWFAMEGTNYFVIEVLDETPDEAA